ncbi:MAG: glycosyltransferase [Ginsengibacter sp.]
MHKHLHIVCLDVPFPVDYGGVFDLFYKITALHQQGIKIHLHCFDYGRGEQDELNKYCTEVFYYKRMRGLKGFSLRLPYIVSSRRNDNLLTNLLRNNYPVLLEGIHCTYYLDKNKLRGKKVFVRLHNVEFEYYKQLAKSEISFFRKIYFLLESRLLKRYEENISSKATFIAVTLKDIEVYKKEFKATEIKYLPVFLPYTSINSKEGKGNYCLYHGNLGVAENEKAATWLLKNVFNELSISLIIAGKNPSKKLSWLARQNTNVSLIANPSEKEMNELINKAQINILPSFNSTGIKIKLLNAIFNGRHCIVNAASVAEPGLEEVCCIAGDSNSFKKNIVSLFDRLFTNEDIAIRKRLLLQLYNNELNARQLIQWIC